jgi:tetratricopeptide (TPR) repeat protein
MSRMFTLALAALLVLPLAVRAENEGQADLDKATDLQLGAESLGELEKVIELAESALKKGLDEGQTEFAKQMLAATLFQHANRTAEAIFGQSPPSRRWMQARDLALEDIAKAKKYDATLPDVFLLEAKLQMLPGGKKDVARASVGEAIKLLKAADATRELSKAYLLRGAMAEGDDERLADFDAAVQADPENTEAWQARALVFFQKGENEKAVADLEKLVEKNAGNPAVIATLAEAMTNLKKYDEALNYSNKLIEMAPDKSLGYSLRARVRVMKEEFPAAIDDLTEALKIDEDDLSALLMRSRLYAAEGKKEQAKADIDKALRIAPDLPQAILTRSDINAANDKFDEAIADMQTLLATDPTNALYRLRLATYMVGDKRPRKAIEILTSVVDSLGNSALSDEDKETKVDALRSRGDALLSVGKHAEAVKDYEEALKLDPENTGVLNNLAWVMATSPDDAVRNADRSIELGLKACELTKYEAPHILSTLASGYAEKGDWETAIKWSTKAVELNDKAENDMRDIDDQLKKELESYQQKKAWREKQEIEENTKPLGGKSTDLET